MNEYDNDETQRDIYTVSQLAGEVREVLEGNFPLVWVEGEISNLANPASGHIYFSLKDAKSQVRCAMFRMRRRLLDFDPDNGMQVLCRAKPGLYEARGDFQLIVEHMEEAGDGALRREYEALKRRLRNEGLFDSAHKQTLPSLPKRIGIITSPTGAAVHDMLTVLKRRFPSIPVLIYPVPVQGEGAAEKIARAIKLANQRNDCDVLIIGRGGGSLEDLWAFNDEHLAHTIFNSKLPIVSAVGHEIDFTIADFVADVRAPTPSAAAELLSPDRGQWLQRLDGLQRRLVSHIQNRLRQHAQHMDYLSSRLVSPRQRLTLSKQRTHELHKRLFSALHHLRKHNESTLKVLQARLMQHAPLQRLKHNTRHVDILAQRLQKSMRNRLQHGEQRLAALGRTLDAVSPLATLGRGYAIARRTDNGELVRDAAAVTIGTEIETRLHKGRLICRIEATKNDS